MTDQIGALMARLLGSSPSTLREEIGGLVDAHTFAIELHAALIKKKDRLCRVGLRANLDVSVSLLGRGEPFIDRLTKSQITQKSLAHVLDDTLPPVRLCSLNLFVHARGCVEIEVFSDGNLTLHRFRRDGQAEETLTDDVESSEVDYVLSDIDHLLNLPAKAAVLVQEPNGKDSDE